MSVASLTLLYFFWQQLGSGGLPFLCDLPTFLHCLFPPYIPDASSAFPLFVVRLPFMPLHPLWLAGFCLPSIVASLLLGLRVHCPHPIRDPPVYLFLQNVVRPFLYFFFPYDTPTPPSPVETRIFFPLLVLRSFSSTPRLVLFSFARQGPPQARC